MAIGNDLRYKKIPSKGTVIDVEAEEEIQSAELVLASGISTYFKRVQEQEPVLNRAEYDGKVLKAEDKAILTAYDAVSDNRVLINLADTIHQTGSLKWDRSNGNNGYVRFNVPTLVIAPAKAKEIRFSVSKTLCKFSTRKWSFEMVKRSEWQTQGSVRIPHIPARVIPSKGLDDLFILWEPVEHDWTHARGELVVSTRDPALLEHIAGNLFSVVTTWELTEIERAALGG